MASAELPQNLMDIVSSLTQDDIPFKLRCAVCNKLAINAFRLPCCDQAICENCQTSLPESCPVCDHNPVSRELCKPNKALRTTLKAFLRTEEKKREKDRSSNTPAVNVTPAPVASTTTEAHDEAAVSTNKSSENANSTEAAQAEPALAVAAEKLPNDQSETAAEVQTPAQENGTLVAPADDIPVDNAVTNGASAVAEASEDSAMQPDMADSSEANQMMPNTGFDISQGMMSVTGWNDGQDFGAMAQFMPNTMGNFQNPMGMPGMGPMAAAQGMFGGYGMNMNNMSNGMNMGFGAEQQMYSNWDISHNNMYNPTAYSNGMGQNYGASGYAGYMSQPNGNYSQVQQYPNQDQNQYQNGYYGNGPGYMRGMGRGRGRGYYRGRGGYDGHMHANHHQQSYYNQNSVSQEPMNPNQANEEDVRRFNDELAPGGKSDFADGPSQNSILLTGPDEGKDKITENNLDSNSNAEPARSGSPSSQLQGIPTIDSIDSAPSQPMGFPRGQVPAPVDKGYGRGRGFNRGGFMNHRGGFYNANNNIQGPPVAGPGVVGAPVAPRAMRQGLPNTTSNRGRPYSSSMSTSHVAGHDSHSATPTTAQENLPPRSPSALETKMRSPSPAKEGLRQESCPPSPSLEGSRHRRGHRRDQSESVYGNDEDRDTRKDRHRRSRRDNKEDHSRSRSPSPTEGSRRSSHRPDKDRDRERDRERDRDHKSSHRSYRSRRHRSRSESRHRGRESALEANNADKYDLATRITNAQRLSKGVSSHRRESKDKPRKGDHEDRDKRNDYDHHESDRGYDRDRRRDREKYRDRGHERDREKDRKRSRRERSASPDDSDASRRKSRRSKHSHRDDYEDEKERDRPSTKSGRSGAGGGASTKDPHTLEREARDRERMMREQQRRDAKVSSDRDGKSSRRQHAGRRLNYKYEGDDDDMSRAEEEREASRWA